jgi:hypothetical protein
MGWWEVDRSGEKVTLGDESLDILGEAFQAVTRAYVQEWKRKPTLAEILQTIEMVLVTRLEEYASGGDSLELVTLLAKTKKRRKSQPYKVGDFFAVPLGGGKYAHGRILSNSRPKMGFLVGIYNQVGERILTPEELQGSAFMFPPLYCGPDVWKTWRWRIIGHGTIQPGEFIYPKFKEGYPGFGWRIRDENAVYPATEEEVRNLEYATLWAPKRVEDRIRYYLEEHEEEH